MPNHHHHHHPGLAFGAGMAVGAGMVSTGRGGSDQVTVTKTGNTTTVTDVHRNRFGKVTEVDTVVRTNNRAPGPVYVAPAPRSVNSTVVVNPAPPMTNTVVYRPPPPKTNVIYTNNNNAGPVIYTPPPQQNKTVIINGGPKQQQVPVATQVPMQPPQQPFQQPLQQPLQQQQPQQWPVTPYMTEFSQLFFSAQPEQKVDGFGKASWILPPMKARDVLIRETQLPTTELKKIWDLVEEDGSGDLDLEEFGLAMFLARNLKNGIALPSTLPEYLKPPSHPVSPSNPF